MYYRKFKTAQYAMNFRRSILKLTVKFNKNTNHALYMDFETLANMQRTVRTVQNI